MNELLGDFAQDGFQLLEPKPNLLILWCNDVKVATFNKINTTRQVIQSVCFDWSEKGRRLYGTRKPRRRDH